MRQNRTVPPIYFQKFLKIKRRAGNGAVLFRQGASLWQCSNDILFRIFQKSWIVKALNPSNISSRASRPISQAFAIPFVPIHTTMAYLLFKKKKPGLTNWESGFSNWKVLLKRQISMRLSSVLLFFPILNFFLLQVASDKSESHEKCHHCHENKFQYNLIHLYSSFWFIIFDTSNEIHTTTAAYTNCTRLPSKQYLQTYVFLSLPN